MNYCHSLSGGSGSKTHYTFMIIIIVCYYSFLPVIFANNITLVYLNNMIVALLDINVKGPCKAPTISNMD